MADEGLVVHAALRFVGIAHDEGDAEAALVDGGLAAGKGHAVIGGEDDEGLFVEAGFLEDLDEAGDASIDAGDALVVLGEFLAGLGIVGEKGRDGDFGRIVEDFLDAGEGAAGGFVAEEVGLQLELRGFVESSAAVRVGGGEVEEEGAVVGGGEEAAAFLGHLDGVALVPLQVGLEAVDLLGGDMEFPDVSGAVAGALHDAGQGVADDGIHESKPW